MREASLRRRVALFALGAVLPLAAARAAPVDAAWSRATPDATGPGALFATIHGDATADQLVGVTTPVARTAMLHEMDMSGDTMRMRMVPAMAVPPHGTLTLGPTGNHVMLMGLARTLHTGDSFPATFRFAHAAPVTVTVHVAGPGAAKAP